MEETWRWFGPDDPVTLEHVRQAGATGVVTALHHLNQGRAWPEEEVARRKAEIEAAGLAWLVPSGGYALRFDWTDLAAYDLFVLRRPGAEADHPPGRRAAAEARFRAMSESDIAALE